MFNKRYLFLLLVIFGPVVACSQRCDLQIIGQVTDASTGLPLHNVVIFAKEINFNAISDDKGNFVLSQLCPAFYHLTFSHIGCAPINIGLRLENDTILSVILDHHSTELEGVTISESKQTETLQASQAVTEKLIFDNANQTLSELLENVTGVSTLRTGAGISKPVVHGLYGHRLTIMNNGIAQSGQLWGNDHAPEIDPLIANRITVIKSVSAIAYPGSNLGSVILVESGKINRDPHLHGRAAYYYESNGRSHGTNVQLQKYYSSLGWRVNGTLKRAGDRNAPDYFLRNTGSTEANVALQLEKNFGKKLFTELYASSFNTRIGVLRGAHIGNLRDLDEALSREIPFFTEQKYRADLDAPRQNVNHHLLKLSMKYFLDDHAWLSITTAGQINHREEYDIRRGGRTTRPALSINQLTHYVETKYRRSYFQDNFLELGFQNTITDNTNNPQTGILPLIPDYSSLEYGAYTIYNHKINRLSLEAGLRYDYVYQDVATISADLPRRIERFNNRFNNLSASTAASLSLHGDRAITINIGYATRNPGVHELYSSGLHQGVSGIEQGNSDLKLEKSLKTTLGFSTPIGSFFKGDVLFYHQYVNDYIYLRPTGQFNLTIRGAFPVFMYTANDVTISGMDINTQWILHNSLTARINYSYIRGRDIDNQVGLINIPASTINSSLRYEFPEGIKLKSMHIQNMEILLAHRYVSRRDDITIDQDFVLPPEAYHLFSIKIAGDLRFIGLRMRLFAKAENLFNVRYRDYLNRQRYFADDLGRKITMGFIMEL